MVRANSFWLSALLAFAVTVGAASTEPRIAFDTRGGDAWTFSVRVSGRAAKHDCDSVIVRSPLGTADAVQFGRDRFHAEVELDNGHNRIQAICRKAGREVARSEPQLWRVALADTPKAWIRLRVDKASVRLDAGRTEPAPAKPVPVVTYEWRARAGNPEPLRLVNGSPLDWQTAVRGEHVELAIPSRDGEYYVELQAADALGRIDRSAAVFRVAGGRAQEIDSRTQHPEWVDSAVLYGAAPYFFDPPNFHGVRERLDEIAALGASAIWLSPVNAAPDDDFGYAVTDHFDVRERFGTEKDFRALVDEAHRLGLKVLMDFVPNHLSDQSAYYLDAVRDAERSAYHAWFERDTEGEVTHYFDWTHLVNLNYDSAQVRAYIGAALARLVRDYDIDGFRVDASWAVAQRAPEFWPLIRAELKRIDPDIFLLAEASAREPYHVANGFDAAYDWTWNLGEWAWRDVFKDDGTVDLDRLRAALTNDGRGYPQDSLILRFINNNDTGERFVSRYGEPLTKLAATLLLTLPGLPLIYVGDEVGAAFEPYDEGPPIEWNDRSPLVAHYRQLIRLRRGSPTLQTREMQLLRTDQDDAVLSYLRPADTSGEDILVLLNFSEREQAVRPVDSNARERFQKCSRAEELLSASTVEFSRSRPVVRIRPLSALVLRAR